ncbi:hypothetical protein IQ270_07760 [Microcoleus sp. LEGE 07076]|uniref:hypothetical protein n=1 Tax=Microcoleus sp. LEGE 07076 TaxID=915322 RepID=UPI0018804122|nr:hypothetical protein [Microcoleus sp. LEGE 07076]MBE9184618.1 hypothetical protein [Microcoleus sp. LEGE 07076]
MHQTGGFEQLLFNLQVPLWVVSLTFKVNVDIFMLLVDRFSKQFPNNVKPSEKDEVYTQLYDDFWL